MEKVTVTINRREYSLKTDENPEKIKRLAYALEKNITYVARIAKGSSETEITTMAAMLLLCDVENEVSEKCRRESESAITAGEREKDQLKNAAEELKRQLDKEKRLNAENPLAEINQSLTNKNSELLSQTELLKKQIDRLNEENKSAAAAEENEKSKLKAEIENMKNQLGEADERLKKLAAAKDAELAEFSEKAKKSEEELWALSEEQEKKYTVLKEEHEKFVADNKVLLDEKDRENIKMRGTLENYETTFDMYVKKKEEELRRTQEELETLRARNSELEKGINQIGGVQMKIC